jgi:hypothetical protein
MGESIVAIFKSIVDSIDGSSDLAQAEREALEALEGMAEAKKELFEKEINLLIIDAGVGTNKTVPISKVLRASGMARAYSSNNAADIPKAIEDAVGNFIEGGADNIVKGIFGILSKALEVFLGASEGRSESIKDYFVYATDYAIYRVDLMAWGRYVKAASLKTRIEQATSYSYCISNVDITKITWADFVAIFALQLDQVPTLTKEQRTEARERMKETWDFLQGPTSPNLAVADQMTSFAKIEAEYQLPLLVY